MNKEFKRFQKKYYLEVILKDLFVSLSVSLVCSGILVILDKLKVISWNIVFNILIPLVVFGGLFVPGWFIFKPKDNKVSKRIDKELNLNQKVETMINFEKEDGELIKLQREDTIEILSKTPTKSFKLRFSPLVISALIVGTLTFSTSMAIPSRKGKINVDPTQTEIVLDEKSKWYIAEIESIAVVINQSAMNQEIKDDFTKDLYDLIDKIKKDGSNNYGGYALDAIKGVKSDLKKNNSIDDISDTFLASENNTFVQLGNDLASLEYDKIIETMTGLRKSLEGKNTASLVKYVVNQIKRIDKSNILEGDVLYKYFQELVEKLDAIPVDDSIDSTSQIEEAFSLDSEELRIAILTQRLNSNMANYVNSELRRIFDLPEEKEDTGDDSTQDDEDDEDKSDDDSQDDPNKQEEDKKGGAGTGEVIYGSDDELFDPEKGVVKYGDVIYEYFSNIFDQIKEVEDEEEKEKLMTLFNYYYEILFGSSEEKEGE